LTSTKWGNHKDADNHELRNHKLHLIAGNHGSPSEGTVHMNTTAHRMQVHNGTTLKQVAWTDDVAGGTVAAADVTYAGSTNLAANDVEEALDELDSEKASTGSVTTVQTNLDNHTGDTTDAHDASAISYAGATGLAATDVEAALDELDSEKATPAQITTAINNLIDSAPGTLDTLNELAAALGDDASFSTTVTTALAARVQDRRFTIGDGSATSFNLDHNLNTKRVICQAYVISTGAQYEPDFDRTTVNRVVVDTGSTALATNAVEVVIMGRSD
jgi:hypothetical protein